MHCWKCGAENDDGYNRCRDCLTPAKKPGLLSRLLGFFIRRADITGETSSYTTTSVSTKRHVAKSLDELPPDIRAQIEATITSGGGGLVSETLSFTYEDVSGRKRTYYSADEMPPDGRALYERIRREHG